jgi:hypothetical protein
MLALKFFTSGVPILALKFFTSWVPMPPNGNELKI